MCFLICDDLAFESETLKSPVSLPDIGTELQNLKLNQENLMNGGPTNDNKKKSLKLKLHESRSKTVLPPLSDRKGKTPREGTKVVKGKGGEKAASASKIEKGDTGKDLIQGANNAGLNENVAVKNESAKNGSFNKAHEGRSPDVSPRRVTIGITNLSPRKSSSILERKPSAI